MFPASLRLAPLVLALGVLAHRADPAAPAGRLGPSGGVPTVRTPSQAEIGTARKAGPALTPAAFTFVPPPHVKKVASLEAGMYDPRLKVGARPFALSGPDLQGRPVSLDQYRGKVLLLDFWATWCGPCVGEIPNVVAAYRKYHPRGFEIVGVSLDEPGARAHLTSFLKAHRMTWRQIYEGRGWYGRTPRRFGVHAIPFTLLVGRDGRIVAVDARGPRLQTAVRAALTR